mmetsp:Transcript_42285/g.122245  ORF Transcript_42285/g.122245 Transcript_42285/m.122245 type:complete len:586 (-) Transcript_42285:255-2012(-)
MDASPDAPAPSVVEAGDELAPEVAELLMAGAPTALAPSPPGKRCQYFVLSPRPSIESPEHRPTDENANHNIMPPRGKLTARGIEMPHPQKLSARGSTPQRTSPVRSGCMQPPKLDYKQQPCLRPSSPAKKAVDRPMARSPTPTRSAKGAEERHLSRPSTPTRCRQKTPDGHAQPRPSTPTRSRPQEHSAAAPMPDRQGGGGLEAPHRLHMTPDRHGYIEDEEALGPEPSMASMSVYSEMSQESRFSRLSRRSTAKRHMSSKELEELQIEEKRRQVLELIKRNQRNCRKALVGADVASAGRAQHVVRKVTMPQEFSFSVPSTPRLRRRDASADRGSEAASDGDDIVGTRRLSRSATQESVGSVGHRAWRPKLTVPQGPRLRTCQRGGGLGRKSLSCPPADEPASASASECELSVGAGGSRAPTPERRRMAYAAAAKAERGRAAAVVGKAANPLGSRPEAAKSAQERAQQARLHAQQRMDEQARAVSDKISIFKRTPGALAARPPVGPSGAGDLQRAPSKRMVQPPDGWQPARAPLSARGGVGPAAAAAAAAAVAPRTPREGQDAVAKATGKPSPSFGSTSRRPCCT